MEKGGWKADAQSDGRDTALTHFGDKSKGSYPRP